MKNGLACWSAVKRETERDQRQKRTEEEVYSWIYGSGKKVKIFMSHVISIREHLP